MSKIAISPTPQQKMVYKELQRRGLEYKEEEPIEIPVRCQVDIWIEPNLIVEIDGGRHRYGDQLLKDRARDLLLESTCGIITLRFSNKEVEASVRKVVDRIEEKMNEC